MKQDRRVILRLLLPGLITFGLSSFSLVHAQDDDAPQFRSRSEQLAEQRKIEKAYPELVRALRTLHLPPDKMAEAGNKLRRSEAATRAARQELQALEVENERQGYDRQSTKSARAEELRATLQQSTDQLHSEIKTLLTPQQREQFERHLQKQNRHKGSNKQKSFRD